MLENELFGRCFVDFIVSSRPNTQFKGTNMSDLDKFQQAMLLQNFQRAEFIANDIGLRAPKIAAFLNSMVGVERGEAFKMRFDPKEIRNKNVRSLASILVAEYNPDKAKGLEVISHETGDTRVFTPSEWLSSTDILARALYLCHSFGHLALLPAILDRWPARANGTDQQLEAEFLVDFFVNLVKYDFPTHATELILRLSNKMMNMLANELGERLYRSEEEPDLHESSVRQWLKQLTLHDLFSEEWCEQFLASFSKHGNMRSFIHQNADIILKAHPESIAVRFLLGRAAIEVELDKESLKLERLLDDLFHGPQFVRAGSMNYHLPFVSSSMAKEVEWGTKLRSVWDNTHPNGKPQVPARPTTDDNYHITFVSNFLRNHGIGHALYGVVDKLKDHKFTYTAVNLWTEKPDDVFQQQIKRNAADWYYQSNSLSKDNESLLDAASWISARNTDALVNLDGLMDVHSLELLTHPIAPLTMYWIGHGSKINLPVIDYVVTDAFVNANYPADYGEKEIRLPNSFVNFDAIDFDANLSKSDFGIPSDTFVFSCFNNPIKVTRDYLECLAEIARCLNFNVLFWFAYYDRAEFVRLVVKELAALGVPRHCIKFGGRLEPKAKHFARLAVADLALDTFNVNMASGALDYLWAGIPVLTMVGENYTSRICGSFNKTIGLEQFNVETRQDYIAKAINLAREPKLLSRAKKHLLATKAESSLFNSAVFTAELCAGLKLAIDRSRRGEEPTHIDVTAPSLT